MCKKIVLILSLFLAAVIFSSNVYAFGFNANKMVDRLSKELSLTQEQKDKFIINSKEIEKSSKDIREINKQLMEKVKIELAKDTPDENVINESVQSINRNNAQLQIKRLQNIIQFKKSLTIDQKKKFEDLMKKRKNHDKDSDKK